MRIYVIKHRRFYDYYDFYVLPSNQANVSFVLGEFKHIRVI
jgi:hypothetical protein